MRAEETIMLAANRPLLVVHDAKEGHLVYDLRFENEQTLELRHFPIPAVPPLHYRPLAVAGGTLLGVHATGSPAKPRWKPYYRISHPETKQVYTVLRFQDELVASLGATPADTVRSQFLPADTGVRDPGPAIMIPVGDDTVIRMDTVIYGDTCRFEALRRVPGDGGRWRTDPLPRPPIWKLVRPFDSASITAYFAMGAHVWISVAGMGAFSLDTRTDSWRIQPCGEELQLEGRAVFVPELGALVGLAAGTQLLCSYEFSEHGEPRWKRTCTWLESAPWSGRRLAYHCTSKEMVSLAYLGKGRFCICRAITALDLVVPGGFLVFNDWCTFLVVELTRAPDGTLQLSKRGDLSYHGEWPEDECLDMYLIQPDVGACTM
ncbi:hypothetical protein ACP4OV_004097 [Aristida adscensionis]